MNMDYSDGAAERLVQHSSDDDSDVDEVTDYLNSNTQDGNRTGPGSDVVDTKSSPDSSVNKSTKSNASATNSRNTHQLPSQNNQQSNHQSHNHHINNNMVPIISVTPHSPGAKFNNILEDTLNQLQHIRESVVQMKNSSSNNHHHYCTASGLINPALSASRLFSSCPSLPDLTAAASNGMWPTQQSIGGLNNDRRKSWTAIEDLTMECVKNSHKSVSLSSLDSEEQESLRAAERLHNRSSRNSTGGISTHSLNEVELARDFERLNAKRNLVPQIPCNRMPLQKSISTPSIAPIRNQNAKEESTVPTSRHLSDSEDDNQDDRSLLLCVRDKIEVYADHPEKRRKRGSSLFFRKKKDKSKTKGQSTNCDGCGAVINLATYKDHAVECKARIAKSQQNNKSSGKKNSTSSGKKMTGCYSPWRLVANKLGVTSPHASHHNSSSHTEDQGRDYYDGHSHNNDHANYSDESPLIPNEFLNEPHITSHNLGGDPILGVMIENEPDQWSSSVPSSVVRSLKEKQVKRQEQIYEIIMTEKHHCQILLLMQRVFVESLQRNFSQLNPERLFPRLAELTEMHTGFLKKLRIRQRASHIVDGIGDILLEFFSNMSAQKLISAYGEFCSNHQAALNTFKDYQTGDQRFAEWHKHKQTNPLLKRKGIPECTLFVAQRLTKYPLLIEALLKTTRENQIELENLQSACKSVKTILFHVDARVAEKQKEDRHLEIFKRIDAKSTVMYKEDKFKKSDVISSNRKLKFEGVGTLLNGRFKVQNVILVVLTDCLFFLQETSQKYSFFTPSNKAGVMSLQKLIIRPQANDDRGLYIISTKSSEMHHLKVQQPKDKHVWIRTIQAAVQDCPYDDTETDEFLTTEQKQKNLAAKQANIRELIRKMRMKDIEQAILLEEKIALYTSYLLESGASVPEPPEGADAFLSSFGSYKELITDDCDTVEISRRVFHAVQEISQLSSSLYKAATGYDLPVARSFSSIGERQSDAYQLPKLPARAETFGGFDERRMKQQQQQQQQEATTPPWKDAVLAAISNTLIQPHTDDSSHNKRESVSSYGNTDSSSLSSTSTVAAGTQGMPAMSKDHYAALQVSHYLYTLFSIINQQMTKIASLQDQLNTYAIRENPKSIYRHNDQLEELRNLQGKFQEEKTAWIKQKEQEDKEREEKYQKLEKELADRAKEQESQLQQIRADQEDIRQQRESLYARLQKLSNQGLLSPNSVIPPTSIVCSDDGGHQSPHGANATDDHTDTASGTGSTEHRRKDKWRSASISKAPPAHLHSATNAPKINQSSVKQQLPLKLSSNSSTKIEKPPMINTITSPGSSNGTGGGVTQILPLKLVADKKNQNLTPNHSRTGSSPEIIQQLNKMPSGNPATRTNSYPKIPEHYRLRSADRSDKGPHSLSSGIPSKHSISSASSPPQQLSQRSMAMQQQQQQQQQPQQQSHPPTMGSQQSQTKDQSQEEIYF